MREKLIKGDTGGQRRRIGGEKLKEVKKGKKELIAEGRKREEKMERGGGGED